MSKLAIKLPQWKVNDCVWIRCGRYCFQTTIKGVSVTTSGSEPEYLIHIPGANIHSRWLTNHDLFATLEDLLRANGTPLTSEMLTNGITLPEP